MSLVSHKAGVEGAGEGDNGGALDEGASVGEGISFRGVDPVSRTGARTGD